MEPRSIDQNTTSLSTDLSCRLGEILFSSYCVLLTNRTRAKSFLVSLSFPREYLTQYLGHMFKDFTIDIDFKDFTLSFLNSTDFTKIRSNNNDNYSILIAYSSSRRPHFSCLNGFFTCEISKECINPKFVCDNSKDCKNGEDEKNCNCSIEIDTITSVCCLVTRYHFITNSRNKQTNLRMKPNCKLLADFRGYSYNNKNYKDSVSNQLKHHVVMISCSSKNKKTIFLHELCLFDRNKKNLPEKCDFGEHLQNCTNIHCTNSFKCPKSYCIPYRRVCDGKWDCPEGDDQLKDCKGKMCPGFLHCKGLTTCLHPSEICDGKVDCSDEFKDDEIFCVTKFSCPQTCKCLGLGIICNSIDPLEIFDHFNSRLISITDSSISILDKMFFCSFQNLLHLNVSFNSIQMISLDLSCKIATLEILDLMGNNLTILVKNQFEILRQSKLKHLILVKNQLKEIHKKAFSGLSYIKVLHLNYMFISLVDELSFSYMKRLQLLDLSQNHIETFPPNILIGCQSLLILDISNNNIKSISVEMLRIVPLVFTFDEICCLLQNKYSSCIVKTGSILKHPKCTKQYSWMLIIIRILVAIALTINFVELSYYKKIGFPNHKADILLSIAIKIIIPWNVLVFDFNLNYFNNETICTFTSITTAAFLHCLSFSGVASSLNTFILIYFPFRRKGLSTSAMFSSLGIYFTMIFGYTFFLTNDITKSSLQSISYSRCLMLLANSYSISMMHSLITPITLVTFLVLKFFIIAKLLVRDERKNATGIKQHVGISALAQTIVFCCFWSPILIIFLNNFDKSLELLLSNMIIMMMLLASSSSLIIHSIIKMHHHFVTKKGRNAVQEFEVLNNDKQ